MLARVAMGASGTDLAQAQRCAELGASRWAGGFNAPRLAPRGTYARMI